VSSIVAFVSSATVLAVSVTLELAGTVFGAVNVVALPLAGAISPQSVVQGIPSCDSAQVRLLAS
jgi:hypothetical protein